ncbi:NUDIX domain-containing protein [Paenibacillus lemnae]|uniref:NUDIX domain-containing protein n=1 Tax=Paenibacillus lemnae TaxID=1330551 RepID=A0A848M6W9_PAELE|nr:NUDIX domain-containing protein [Paenibacillus lemnae]NMO95334.1 NUDIX domain-containing protein [Paenibacillus lemnae]
MKIRNSAKAVIIHNNKLLVTIVKDKEEEFYLLPGGGQEPGEMLKKCLVRECMEETGYEIEVKELLYIRECFLDSDIHRVEFIFNGIVKEAYVNGSRIMDKNQIGIKWIEIENVINEPLFPIGVRSLIDYYSKGKYIKTSYLGEIF